MAGTEVAFTFDEAVRAMGVTPDRLEKLIAAGKIRAVREGIVTLIPRQAILEYLAQVSSVPIRERKK